MREDFWQFVPTHKLIVAANYRPTVTGTDSAIWRRIRVVPFEVVIPFEERNPGLLEQLTTELSGILCWAVEGCKRWWVDGLGLPAAVEAATAQYRDEQDVVGQFLTAEGYESAPSHKMVPAGDLQKGLTTWCEANGVEPLSKEQLAMALRGKGFIDIRKHRGRFWTGLTRPKTETSSELDLEGPLENPCSEGGVTQRDAALLFTRGARTRTEINQSVRHGTSRSLGELNDLPDDDPIFGTRRTP
jgi:phage/plasmid-associated DNA primase